jgi:hypothetical protein
MSIQNGPGSNPRGDGGGARDLDRLGRRIEARNSTPNDAPQHQPAAEAVLDGEALTLLTSVPDLCGSGINWAGVVATVEATIKIFRQRPLPDLREAA